MVGAMDAFIRRLLTRLCDESQPLSRNRHFHAFDSPEGRQALKLSRRLKSLQRDLLCCLEEGRRVGLRSSEEERGEQRIELRLERARGYRVSVLRGAEFELLQELPGVRAVLESAAAASPPLSGRDASKTKDAGPRISTFEKSGSQRT